MDFLKFNATAVIWKQEYPPSSKWKNYPIIIKYVLPGGIKTYEKTFLMDNPNQRFEN